MADAEAGFGGPLNAFELMKAYIEAGAAGVHYEDQLASEKKCGHLGGKVLIPTAAHIRNLTAARLAADVMGTPTRVDGQATAFTGPKPESLESLELADARARLHDMDAEELELQVIYPSLFLYQPLTSDRKLAAALQRWESKATGDAMKALAAIPDARKRLELMLRAASEAPRSRSLYAALAEAAEDPGVRRVLDRVACKRIRYLEVCYAELGLSPALAKARALLAYAAYRGLLQLAHEAPAALPKRWAEYPRLVQESLLPVEVYASVKRSVTPKINAISTVMLVLSMTLVAISQLIQRRR